MAIQVRKLVSDEEFKKAWENNDNQGVMRKALKRYSHMLDRDELTSCSLRALWRALQYFDESYGQKFTSSLTRFVQWHCAKECSKKNRRQTLMNIHGSGCVAERDKYTDKALVDDWRNVFLQEDVEDLLVKLNGLGDDDRVVLTQRYLEKKTLREIGRENGYSKQTARMKILKAVDNLKQACGVVFIEESKSTK